MSDPGPFSGMWRRSGVALLLVALLVPAFSAGLGEASSARSPEEAILVAPDATQEMPSDRETAGTPLLLLFPAGIVDHAAGLPEPSTARVSFRAAERLPGDAVLPSPAPPPRRA